MLRTLSSGIVPFWRTLAIRLEAEIVVESRVPSKSDRSMRLNG